ncbi:MAG: 16S rRNA (guanine(966)-N(2))-methyltransferase RsmD [Microthrixaceae bacterium]
MSLRVVAGSLRGRRLETPAGESTRPTADRVREAVFNSLDASGFIRGAKVLDLFAGSGALGIEALSRGAGEVTFIENSRPAVGVIRSNVEFLGLDGSSRIIAADVMAYLSTRRDHFDLVLADPPYAFDQWDELLELIDADAVMIESDRAVLDSIRYGGTGEATFEVIRERRYGATVVTIAVSRRGSEHDELHDEYRKDPQ